MPDNKVSLHRVIKASPEKVYRAFTEAEAIASWLPPWGFVCEVHEMDVRVGGKYKMTFHNFTTQSKQSFGGEYLEIKPNEFLKYKDKFDDPNLPGTMTYTIRIQKTSVGTDLSILQEDIPAAIPAEMCYLGWQDSLDKLIRLVEPDIQDN